MTRSIHGDRRLLGVLLFLLATTAPARDGRAAPAGPTGGVQRFVIVPGESQVSYRVNELFINFLNRTNSPNVAKMRFIARANQ